MCLYPRIMRNPRYKPNKKNNGIPPACHDKRMMYISIGCGKCIECRRKEIRSWIARIETEQKFKQAPALFVTFTFNDESLWELREWAINWKNQTTDENDKEEHIDNIVAKRAMRLFLKRWVKKFGKTLRHFATTELGEEKGRIHIHAIVWTTEIEDLQKTWGYGTVDREKLSSKKGIKYVTKYIKKPDKRDETFVGRVLASPGIGSQFTKTRTAEIKKQNWENEQQYIKLENGQKVGIPMYWRQKIFSEEQRLEQWKKILDKNERWILGEKYDVSTIEGQKQYMKAVLYQQQKYERLGYQGLNEWNEKKYQKSLQKSKIINTFVKQNQ